MYHPLIQPNQQPSQPKQPPTTPRWASRAWPLFLLLPFAAIHAFFRETPDNHPRTFHSGRKSDFSTYFCTQTVCSIIIPQSIPPPPFPPIIVYLKEIFLFVVAAVLRFDVFIYTVFPAHSFPALCFSVALPISQPRCCQFKCFRNYTPKKKIF